MEKDGGVGRADTGFGRSIFGQKAALGISPESVDHILLTHMHGDHIGGMLREGAPACPNADVTISTNGSGYWGSVELMMGKPENNRGNFMSAQSVIKAFVDKVRFDEPFTLS